MKKIIFLLFILSLFAFGCGPANIDNISKTLNTYTMEIIYNDENKSFSCDMELNYKNKFDTNIESLFFHLYPTAFKESAINKPVGILSKEKAYPNGESFGDISIFSITQNNSDMDYNFSGNDLDILEVILKKPLDPNDAIKINFKFDVKLPNINHRFGYGNNTINIANFYPILAVYEKNNWSLDPYHYNGDPFYSDIANYKIKLNIPSYLKLATSGNIISTNFNDETANYTIEAKAVRDYAFVMSDKFEVLTDAYKDINISYFYYNDDNPQEFLQTAVDSVKTFNDLFGDYPYKQLSIVKCNFVHGGMEYPQLVYISDEIVDRSSYINVIIHEIAHQWWYGVIGSDEFSYPWLDEGLTEYSTLLFYENNPNYGINTEKLIKTTTTSYATFVELYTSVLGNVDTTMNRSLNEYNTEPEYVYITYVKGMLFFDSLREVVGDYKFFNSLKFYYKNNAYKNVTPDHLLSSFEKCTNTNLQSFFDSWINGKVNIISN